MNKQAHCRYGPSAAYLHAADLYPGDVGTVRGRFVYSKWLFVKFDKLDYFCWVAPSVIDVVGDISKINLTELNLQAIGSNRYGPPNNVNAVRDGNKVIISWDQVMMTSDKDRGYFIDAFVCQAGAYLWWTFSYPDQFTTSYTVKDEAGVRRTVLRFLVYGRKARLFRTGEDSLAQAIVHLLEFEKI